MTISGTQQSFCIELAAVYTLWTTKVTHIARRVDSGPFLSGLTAALRLTTPRFGCTFLYAYSGTVVSMVPSPLEETR